MPAPLLTHYTKLYSQLAAEQLANGYLITGSEPLQLSEVTAAITQLAQQLGFTERVSVTLSSQTNWDELYLHCQNLSLFSEKKLLHLTLPDGQLLTNPFIAALEKLLMHYLHADLLLLLQLPSVSRAQEKQRWFQCWPNNSRLLKLEMPSLEQLPNWVKQRATKLKLQLDEAALQSLCHHYEGNLLTLVQILNQLVLLYPDGHITLPRLDVVLFNMAIFTPYEWLKNLMEGKLQRSLTILHRLKENETDPIHLLRILQKELLLLLHFKVMQPKAETFFDTHKIWQARRVAFLTAQQQLTRQQIEQALLQLAEMECDTKQFHPEFIWDNFEKLSFILKKQTK